MQEKEFWFVENCRSIFIIPDHPLTAFFNKLENFK